MFVNWIAFVTNRVSWLSDIMYVMIHTLVKRDRKNDRLLPSSYFNWLKSADILTEDPCWHRCWHRYLILWHTLGEGKWEPKHSCNLSTYIKSPFRFHTAFFSPPSHSLTHVTCTHIKIQGVNGNYLTLADGRLTHSQLWGIICKVTNNSCSVSGEVIIKELIIKVMNICCM